VRATIFQIRLVHTVIFWVLSPCVLYALFSGIADRVTVWTARGRACPEARRSDRRVVAFKKARSVSLRDGR
jgi:hypothetical protein